MKKLYWIVLAAALSAAVSGADLVKNGHPAACIPVNPNAGEAEKFAASELAFFVKKMTGAELKREAVPGLTQIRFVLLKQPLSAAQKKEYPALTDLGFAVSSGKKEIVISGMRPRAFSNAVYYLLKEYGGVRFFHPRTEPYIPSVKTFAVPDGVLVKNPVFKYPDVIANGVWTTPDMMKLLVRSGLTLCMTPSPNLRNDKSFRDQYACSEKLGQNDLYNWGGHYMAVLLVGPEKYNRQETEKLLREHPEYFGLRNGKRVICTNPPFGDTPVSQPCLSNPEVKKRMLASAVRIIERDFKDRDLILSLCNDDHTNWCECENCRKLDDPKAGPQGKRSDRWWDFVNYMASNLLPKYPKLSIKVAAYQDFRDVPRKVKPYKHERLFVNLCPHGRCYLHSLQDPECRENKKSYDIMNSWWNTGIRTVVFEYFEVLPGVSPYLPIEYAYARDLETYAKNNVIGMRLMIIGGRQYFLKHPYYEKYYTQNHWESLWKVAYVLGYLNWHPGGDWRKSLKEGMEKYYGKAAPQMLEYHKIIADTFRKNGSHASYGGGNDIFGKVYDAPGTAKKLSSLLDSALKIAADDRVVLARIAKDAELFRKNFMEASFADFSASGSVYRMEKAEKITLDGVLNEPEWIKASSTDELYTDRVEITVGQFESRKADPRTSVKMLYDRDHLYFGIECFKAPGARSMDVKTFKGDFPWSSSHIEIFLLSPELARAGKYRQIAFTRNGIRYNSLAENMAAYSLKDPVPFDYVIRDYPDRWVAEVKISAAKVGKIRDGGIWKINVARNDTGANGKTVSSAFTGRGGNYHTLSHFLTAAFGSDGPVLLNGSFEKLTDKKVTKYSGKNWIFLSKEIPADWTFVNNMKGPAEARMDGASDGKVYLRFGTPGSKKKMPYPTILQNLRITDPDAKKFRISMDLRGDSTAGCRVNVQGVRGNFGQKSFFVRSKEWKKYEYSFTLDKPGSKVFLIDFAGEYADIDNIRITVEK